MSQDSAHRFSKQPVDAIRLLVDLGLAGDAHAGKTVQHLSRVRRDPAAPNRRQVHLIHAELHDELAARGFEIAPGDMGENVTTRGIDLLGLPTGAHLRLGEHAVVELTGLRNPCLQLDRFAAGLLAAVLEQTPEGGVIRKAGVMAVVVAAGEVRAGDPIEIALPAGAHRPLLPV
ncbi:MAG: MOSC domain-containing protein [Jatrophihabitantaceae bacterium]